MTLVRGTLVDALSRQTARYHPDFDMLFSAVFVLTALPFLVVAVPAVDEAPSGIAIPILTRFTTRQPDGSVNATALQGRVRSSVAKIQRGFAAYEKNTGAPHPLVKGLRTSLKRATGSDALTDAEAQLWYGTISVGTPAKTYTVDFDTGSSDLFLPASNCGASCAGHTKYSPSASSTSKSLEKSFNLAYGDGSTVSGTQYTDTVSISGLTATKQTLGAARTYSSGFGSNEFPPDGLLGMAFQSISDYNAPPLFQSLISQGKVTAQQFGFYLAESGSELFIGGTNSALYSGGFTYAKLTDKSYWQTKLDAFSVNHARIIGSTVAIIDTGTTQIIGDSSSVASIYSKIPGAKSASQYGEGIYTIPCSFDTPTALTFGGKVFNVSPKTFNLGAIAAGSSTCIGGLAADDQIGGAFWIVGDVFLQNAYTVFDVAGGRVGFADLAHLR